MTQITEGKHTIWLDLDQEALDNAYDQTVYAPNFAQLNARRVAKSAEARRRLGEPQRRSYGISPVEQLDIYRTTKKRAPTLVIIHGGAWRAGVARDFADAVEVFVRAGAHCVVPDFVNVIDAGGSLFPMAEQVCRASAWVAAKAESFGADPDRIYLFGRSSGAHLAGVAVATDWPAAFGLSECPIKGAVLSSGIYDLKPARLSKRSAYVRFTDDMEDKLSPRRHIERVTCPVTIAYGTFETPEFQRQSQDFAEALKKAGKSVQLLVGEGYNHFELPETLGNPYGLLGRATLELMGLT